MNHDVLWANGRPFVWGESGPLRMFTVPHSRGCLVEERVQSVGKKFMLKVDRRSRWILEGVHGNIEVGGHFADGPSDRKKPFQFTRRRRRPRRTKALRFSMPVSWQVVITRGKDFVKMSFIVSTKAFLRSMIGG